MRIGVTVIFAAIIVELVLEAMKAGTVPLPLPCKPMAVFELVQLKVVPGRLLLKLYAGILVPEHTVELTGTLTLGNGLTVIVKLEAFPAQPLKKGVTVMIEEMGEELLFTAENAGKLPLPFDARPIEEFELVQV